ncbi:MAG: ATP-dependent Clp protease ATP-binding subunit [Patescibacteria group bacterium]
MKTVYIKDPRFDFPGPVEFFVRLVVAVWYAFLSVATALFLFSGNSRLLYAGILFALFLLDRLLHAKQGEKKLYELEREENANLIEAMTSDAFHIVRRTFRRALITKQDFHLLLLREMCARPDAQEALRRLDTDPKAFLTKVEESLSQSGETKEGITREAYLERIGEIVREAYQNAKNTNERFIETRNVLVGLAAVKDPSVAKLFALFSIETADLGETVIFGRWRKMRSGLRRIPAAIGGFANQLGAPRHRIMNRAWTSRPTPMLDEYGTDYTDLARAEKSGFLIGHQAEYNHLVQIISRPGKPNVLLIGEPGSGKSTLIAHLAFQMTKDKVPPVLYDKRLVSLDLSELLANAPREVLSGRLQKVADEIIKAGNIVLHVPNIHDLFRTSDANSMNAIDIFLPIIKNAQIPVVGETFPRECKQWIEPRTDFLDQFERVTIEEISEADALRFLIYDSMILEREFKVMVTFRALKKAVEVAHRYFRQKPLPGSASDLLKQALASVSQDGKKIVDESAVVEVAERQSKIPIEQAHGAEAEKLLNLEATIHAKLVNQEAAVKAVARALREYRSGLARKGGPIAIFLFVGPTGVGKTELAKILAQTQFGSKDALSRFDMSEYQDKQSIFRLIGNPDGSRSGTLTDAVFEKPFSLVLLDEFEKSNPDLLNIFLQVFDDGRLTDSLGRTVSFENTIIIATSNAHSDFIKEEIEKGNTSESIAGELKKKLTTYFKPELINRFSDIIVFRSLNIAEIKKVTAFMIKEIADTLMETQGVELRVEDSALSKIAEVGYSPVFGARPLRNAISENVRSTLADKILRKEIARGNILSLVHDGEKFDFKTTA